MEPIIDYPVRIYFVDSNGERGRPFIASSVMLEEYNFHPGLLIDFSSNYNLEKDNAKIFEEIREIISEKKDFKGFYVESGEFYSNIEQKFDRYRNFDWIIELKFNKNDCCLYSAKIDRKENYCHFNVLETIGIKSVQ